MHPHSTHVCFFSVSFLFFFCFLSVSLLFFFLFICSFFGLFVVQRQHETKRDTSSSSGNADAEPKNAVGPGSFQGVDELAEMDDWGSAWQEAKEKGEGWGGRGKGGRGIHRNTWQPKDIYVEGDTGIVYDCTVWCCSESHCIALTERFFRDRVTVLRSTYFSAVRLVQKKAKSQESWTMLLETLRWMK